ncbi:hypothetical protein CARUB_v10006950mg [Capsella rubella]|uniref:FBD domain-containing protein n=1 Tax=Capsella rubella TaxID=81985 RepID=R0F8Y5_9BRAS|nr:hypothetical protein CARUB_v10006950mg [Capsella rubella]
MPGGVSIDLDYSDLLYPERHSEDASDSFRDFVDKTLSGCNNNSLEKVSLKYQDDDVLHCIGLTKRWISKALEQSLSDLDLCLTMPLMPKRRLRLLPDNLFISKTLVKLTLGTEICLGNSPFQNKHWLNNNNALEKVSLKYQDDDSLATLHFEGNKKEYWKLLCNMIEKAPKLETLVLTGLCGISDCGDNINGGNVMKVVEIQGFKGRLEEFNQVKCFLREMENLEEMKVNMISDETDNKLQLTNDLLALPKRSSKCKIHVL